MKLARRFIAAERLPNGHIFVLAADRKEFINYIANGQVAANELTKGTPREDRLLRLHQAAFLAGTATKLKAQ